MRFLQVYLSCARSVWECV